MVMVVDKCGYYLTGTRIVDFSNIHVHGKEIFVVFVNLKISGFFNILYGYDHYL